MAIAVYTSLLTLDEAPSGTVTVYDAGTTTPRAIYTDTGLTTAATNPIPLDSAGRHSQGMVYTAATAYKVVVKDSAGVTVYTRDNIDPGVPLGTGRLAIANGGTGADDAAEAIANLGAASAAEVADLASDVADLVGAQGSVEKTHIATGTTAQRPDTPEEGDIRRNTTTSKYEGYDGTDWDNFLTDDDIATQADMEAASSAVKVVPPSVVKNHPGVAKAWAFVTVTAGAPALTANYNVTSVTDGGVGTYVLNLTTPFSSTDFAAVATPFGISDSLVFSIRVASKTASTITVQIYKAQDSGSSTAETIDASFFLVAFGDQ